MASRLHNQLDDEAERWSWLQDKYDELLRRTPNPTPPRGGAEPLLGVVETESQPDNVQKGCWNMGLFLDMWRYDPPGAMACVRTAFDDDVDCPRSWFVRRAVYIATTMPIVPLYGQFMFDNPCKLKEYVMVGTGTIKLAYSGPGCNETFLLTSWPSLLVYPACTIAVCFAAVCWKLVKRMLRHCLSRDHYYSVLSFVAAQYDSLDNVFTRYVYGINKDIVLLTVIGLKVAWLFIAFSARSSAPLAAQLVATPFLCYVASALLGEENYQIDEWSQTLGNKIEQLTKFDKINVKTGLALQPHMSMIAAQMKQVKMAVQKLIDHPQNKSLIQLPESLAIVFCYYFVLPHGWDIHDIPVRFRRVSLIRLSHSDPDITIDLCSPSASQPNFSIESVAALEREGFAELAVHKDEKLQVALSTQLNKLLSELVLQLDRQASVTCTWSGSGTGDSTGSQSGGWIGACSQILSLWWRWRPQDVHETTFLHVAAVNENRTCLESLDALWACVGDAGMMDDLFVAVDSKGYTALHLAVKFENYDMAKRIIQGASNSAKKIMLKKAEVDFKGTPLHDAAMRGNEQIVNELVDAARSSGALEEIVILKDKGQKTPLGKAEYQLSLAKADEAKGKGKGPSKRINFEKIAGILRNEMPDDMPDEMTRTQPWAESPVTRSEFEEIKRVIEQLQRASASLSFTQPAAPRRQDLHSPRHAP